MTAISPTGTLDAPVLALTLALVCCGALVMSCSYDYSALNGPEDASPSAVGGTGGAQGGGVLNVEAGGTGGGMISSSSSSSGGGQVVDAGGPGIDGPEMEGPAVETGGAPGIGGPDSSTGGNAGSTGGTGADTPPASSGGSGPGGAVGTGGAASGSGGGVGGAGAGGGGVAGSGAIATGGAGGSAGGGAGGAAGGATTDPDLVLWYKFDESSGTTAADASGAAGGPRNALIATTGLGGKAEFSTLHQVGTHSVSLTGNGTLGGGVVVLPSIDTLAPTAVTLAAWVYEASDVDWQRVFDFGSGYAGPQMFLTPREDKDSKHGVRFVITLLGSSSTSEQIIQSAQAISLNAWHHLAITLQSGSPYTGTLYVDGVAAATNAAMTLHPGQLGFTVQNTIGKSQFPTDPYLTGSIDDFRVYRRALKAAEIAALYAAR